MSSDLGERDAYTLREFCARHGLSRAHFYRLQSLGRSPRLIRAGRRVLVSREAAAEWRREMERDSEEPARRASTPTSKEQGTRPRSGTTEAVLPPAAGADRSPARRPTRRRGTLA